MAEDLETAKWLMVRRDLRKRGIRDRRVLAAMAAVPRERFIDPALRHEAYSDRALGIACGQTISQPYIVALMTEALELAGGEKVLEIGTGSGYQTAVLAELGTRIVSIERHADLSQQAEAVLRELGYRDVAFVVGDGTLGWPGEAPYDRILVAAAASDVPAALFQQLAEGGILVIPIGSLDGQVLQSVRKVSGAPVRTGLSPCRFVPLIGAHGWPERPA
jgi:protein-L-isoaspartate(D-aspartate) O-methyltransferase